MAAEMTDPLAGTRDADTPAITGVKTLGAAGASQSDGGRSDARMLPIPASFARVGERIAALWDTGAATSRCRQDADEGRGQQIRLDSQIDQAGDGADGVVGVQRGEDQMHL